MAILILEPRGEIVHMWESGRAHGRAMRDIEVGLGFNFDLDLRGCLLQRSTTTTHLIRDISLSSGAAGALTIK
jgi:hypothetical protein